MTRLYRIPCCEGQDEPPLCPKCYGAGYYIVEVKGKLDSEQASEPPTAENAGGGPKI